MLEMSQVEYAAHRGVSKQAINKLVKSGKIDLLPSGKIDVAAADRNLGEVRERIVARDEPPAPRAAASGYTPPAEGGLTKAKTATEVYRARLAQLEYDERVGKLLQAEDVARSLRLLGEAIVSDIETLPNLAPELAAAFRQGDEPALRVALKKFARQVQATLAANMRTVGAAATATAPASAALAPAHAA